MKRIQRFLLVSLFASPLALVLAACGGDRHHGGGTGYSQQSTYCAQYASCDTCTPVLGCGWCYDSDGTGQCAPDPDSCATQSFSWTWDPGGCRVPADAGVAPVSDSGVFLDAGTIVTVDASATCQIPAEAGPPASDAGSVGCAPVAGSCIVGGGSGGTGFSLSCVGAPMTADGGAPSPIPTPDPSLRCTIVPVPTPSDLLFYCCPCASPMFEVP